MNANKVLIIDDEAGLRRSLRFGLTQRGWTSDDVEEGLPALKLIERSYADGHPYTCVIADINLPDINGLKLLELIKSSFPEQPVIVVSAYGSGTTADDVNRRHGDGFLPKPFLVDELTAAIGKLEAHAPVSHAHKAQQPVSQGAYVMVRLDESADRMAVFNKLFFSDQVVYCDAVNGPYHVVLLVTAPTQADVERVVETTIRAVPGVADALVCPIVPPRVDPTVREFIDNYNQSRAVDPATEKVARGRKALSTYVFVDIEPGRMAEVLPRLYFLPGVVSCDATEGRHDAVLLFQTHSVAENERILSDELKRIDGIARAKSAKVVNLIEM